MDDFDDFDDIDEIPQEQTTGFPDFVSEYERETEAEILAFVDGVNVPDDIDVETGTPFERNGVWVVRVRVGGG